MADPDSHGNTVCSRRRRMMPDIPGAASAVQGTAPPETRIPYPNPMHRPVSAAAVPLRSPVAPARRREGEVGREAGGGWMSGRASPPFATTDPRETAQCRWPQRFVAARTLSSRIYSARASMTTATLSSGSSRKPTVRSAPGTATGRRRRAGARASGEIASLSTVQRMRPERDEIIICTGVNCTTLGVQYWGDRAVGLFVNAKYR